MYQEELNKETKIEFVDNKENSKKRKVIQINQGSITITKWIKEAKRIQDLVGSKYDVKMIKKWIFNNAQYFYQKYCILTKTTSAMTYLSQCAKQQEYNISL